MPQVSHPTAHPSWCDRASCSADLPGGVHLSIRFPLIVADQTVTACLWQIPPSPDDPLPATFTTLFNVPLGSDRLTALADVLAKFGDRRQERRWGRTQLRNSLSVIPTARSTHRRAA